MNSFLIVRLGSLGDVIHAIPAVSALRARFPDARIDWMVDPRYIEVLTLVAGIDEAIPMDPRKTAGRPGQPGLLGSIRKLRRTRYDAAVDLQGLIKSAILARASGARQTIGFPRAHLREPWARLLYTRTPDPGDAKHVIFKNLALLETLGVHDRQLRFPLTVPVTATVDSVYRRCGRGQYVIINPGAAWPNKQWPADRFGSVASAIKSRTGLRSLVLWGPGEQSLAERVADSASGAADVSPITTITDLFGIAQGAPLMISGDTGPLHIAGAVGTPIVALFGPTWAERNGPWAADDVVLTRTEGCLCLYERRCRKAEPCISDIGVDEVIAAVDRRLATRT